jgi:hypothetical protein
LALIDQNVEILLIRGEKGRRRKVAEEDEDFDDKEGFTDN